MKLTKRHWNVLNELSARDGWMSQFSLPDGNGHNGGGHNASGATMSELKKTGLAEYGKRESASHYGWRITEAGRKALEARDE